MARSWSGWKSKYIEPKPERRGRAKDGYVRRTKPKQLQNVRLAIDPEDTVAIRDTDRRSVEDGGGK